MQVDQVIGAGTDVVEKVGVSDFERGRRRFRWRGWMFGKGWEHPIWVLSVRIIRAALCAAQPGGVQRWHRDDCTAHSGSKLGGQQLVDYRDSGETVAVKERGG